MYVYVLSFVRFSRVKVYLSVTIEKRQEKCRSSKNFLFFHTFSINMHAKGKSFLFNFIPNMHLQKNMQKKKRQNVYPSMFIFMLHDLHAVLGNFFIIIFFSFTVYSTLFLFYMNFLKAISRYMWGF